MKTTVIKVQEVKTEIGISYLAIKLYSDLKYETKDENGNVFFFETIKNKNGFATYMIFEDGKIRFNRPVKIVDDGK